MCLDILRPGEPQLSPGTAGGVTSLLEGTGRAVPLLLQVWESNAAGFSGEDLWDRKVTLLVVQLNSRLLLLDFPHAPSAAHTLASAKACVSQPAQDHPRSGARPPEYLGLSISLSSLFFCSNK